MSGRRAFLKAIGGAAAGVAAAAAGVKLPEKIDKIHLLDPNLAPLDSTVYTMNLRQFSVDLQAGEYTLDYEELTRQLEESCGLTEFHRGKDT